VTCPSWARTTTYRSPTATNFALVVIMPKVDPRKSFPGSSGLTAHADASFEFSGSREGTPTAESSLRTKLEALQERAVTYRANSSEPRQEHYGDFKEHEFVAGEVYRIWHPTNTNVHLSTFLIYSVTGTNMICLRIVQRKLADADYKFRTRHAKLKPVPAADTRRRSSRLSTSKQQTQEDEDAEEYFFRLNRDERMKQDCWVDMIFPWNIDWKDEYLFAFCGCLEQPSFERAKQLHRELYPK